MKSYQEQVTFSMKDLWRPRPNWIIKRFYKNGYLKLVQMDASECIVVFNSYVYTQLENGDVKSALKEICSCLEEKQEDQRLSEELTRFLSRYIIVDTQVTGPYA